MIAKETENLFQPKGRRLYSIRGNIEIQATETKKQLNLHEPEAALAWIDAFKARCRAETKADKPAAGTTPADLQVTDQFLFRCGVESFMKVKSLIAPTNVEIMAFNEIETVLENYLPARKRLAIAEQTKFVAIKQRDGESSGDFLARLKEAARYCEFGNLKAIVDPEAYMIRLRLFAGLQNAEHKLKALEHLQQNPDATIDDILFVIQQREQTVQLVNRQNEQNETVSFARNGQLRKKTTGNDKISTRTHNKAKECPKCGTKHEPRSCPAFGKTSNNCKKPNHFEKLCRMKKQTHHFVGKEANIEENNGSTSDYSCFIGHTDYIKNGTMKKIKVNGKEIPMMKDTGASLTLISKKLWKQIRQTKLEEKTRDLKHMTNIK